MKADLFPLCGHCWDFQNAGILTAGFLTASTCRIWNSLTGIPWPPLALFILMLPKVNLTSHSRISHYRCDHNIVVIWVTENFFFFFFTVFTCILVTSQYLLLLLGPYFFFSFIVPIFAWNVPFLSLTFLKRSLVFPILLISSICFHCSLKAFLPPLTFLWNSAFRWFYLSFFLLPTPWTIWKGNL